MRKLLIVIVILLLIPNCFAATEEVDVVIPDFEVRVNGVLINTIESQYPVLSYKNITYFPMTSDYVEAIGLSLKFSNETGLEVDKNGAYASLEERFLGAQNQLNSVHKAQLAPFNVEVNSKVIDNSKETYPLLVYKNITYFPMTWRFCVDEFGWTTKWDNEKGFEIICGSNDSETTIEDEKEEKSMVATTNLNRDLISWNIETGVSVSNEEKADVETRLLLFAERITNEYFDDNVTLKPFTINVIKESGRGFAYQDNGKYYLNFSENYFEIFNDTGNYFIIYHEFVHVFDFQNFDFWARSFREGLADFLAIEQRQLDLSNQDSIYEDISFSEEELNDFENHMLVCENSDDPLSPYYAGFYFYKYMTEKYGDKVIGKHVNLFNDKKPPFEKITFDNQRQCIIDSMKAITNDDVYKDFKNWFNNRK